MEAIGEYPCVLEASSHLKLVLELPAHLETRIRSFSASSFCWNGVLPGRRVSAFWICAASYALYLGL
jgi:hypothetical protein